MRAQRDAIRWRKISEPTRTLPADYGYTKTKDGLSEPRNHSATAWRIGTLVFCAGTGVLHAQLAPGVPLYNEVLILERNWST